MDPGHPAAALPPLGDGEAQPVAGGPESAERAAGLGPRRAPGRPLLPVVAGAAGGLALVHVALWLWWGRGPVLAELPWLTPTLHGFMALASLCVAFLALGRNRVLPEPVSYWTGLGFAGACLGRALYIPAWPGLGPGGQSLISGRPDTSSYLAIATLALLASSLLAAALAPWPGERGLRGRRWWLSVAAWLVLLGGAGLLLVVFGEHLPAVTDASGSFTRPFVAWPSSSSLPAGPCSRRGATGRAAILSSGTWLWCRWHPPSPFSTPSWGAGAATRGGTWGGSGRPAASCG
ncbi:MAG: hypothetical protein AB1505_03785 [Candidatus Latescibacterota bacterium]